jgi:hypothetical protein
MQSRDLRERTCKRLEDAVMKTVAKLALGRRQFLRALGAGAAATTAAPFATGSMADSETSDEKRKSRYRESDHVKTFYRINRYPS